MTIEVQYLNSVASLNDTLWRSSTSPFLSSAFWRALEDSGAISAATGWAAQHVLLLNDDQPIACLPLFVKKHHRGEYVFDHGWANAYAEHGLDYYPRLVTCVPFSPVVGERVWLADGVELAVVVPHLIEAMRQLAERLDASSWHGLFLNDVSVEALTQSDLPIELAQRTGCQFLWSNADYRDFDDFLARMTAKRRKVIRAERRKVAAHGIDCSFIEGDAITAEDWVFFYNCYVRTYAVRGQKPYLSRAFFEQIGRTMPSSIVLQIAALDNGERIAAALFFKDDVTLYGRYWGSLYDVDCLHFEVCYYRGIDYAIAQGLQFFDPGTQGEHKLIRGFAPIYTHSMHWLADSRFMLAVQDFVARERIGIDAYVAEAQMHLPYRRSASQSSESDN